MRSARLRHEISYTPRFMPRLVPFDLSRVDPVVVTYASAFVRTVCNTLCFPAIAD